MYSYFKKKFKKYEKKKSKNLVKDEFDRNNPLGNGGERVDIILKDNIDFDKLDMYQKNHFKRYSYANDKIEKGWIVGDFACGTGYGSIMLSQKAQKVLGADIDKIVIDKIRVRYNDNKNVEFINYNLLNIDIKNYFNCIVSFETIEHFYESDILKVLLIFNKALITGGILIFSTPFLQKKSEAALKLVSCQANKVG